MASKKGKGDAGGVVTIARVKALTDIIIPPEGCQNRYTTDTAARALVELVDALTNPKAKYEGSEDAETLAWYVAAQAFNRTGAYGEAVERFRAERLELPLD